VCGNIGKALMGLWLRSRREPVLTKLDTKMPSEQMQR
jgi:hypothetical protein